MSLTALLAAAGTVLSIVGTIIVAALRIGRAYGRAEETRARYEKEVQELRSSVAKHGRRLQTLEEGRRRTLTGGGDGE